MFTFAEDDAVFTPQPVLEPLIRLAMREVLNAVKLRMCFIGHPREPRFADGSPDWSKEVRMIETGLRLLGGR